MAALVIGIFLSLATAAASYFTRHEAIVYVPYMFIIPALMMVPRVWYRCSRSLRHRVTLRWVTQLERVGLAIILLNIPGVLFLHVRYPQYQYDRFLHLAAVAVGTYGWGLVLMNSRRLAVHRRRLLTVIGVIIFIQLFVWEGLQWTQDQAVGSHTFYDYNQPIQKDFWEDIGFGALGLLIGLAYLARPRAYMRLLSVRRHQ